MGGNPSNPPATQIIHDPRGRPRRQMRSYLLRGGPERVQLKVSSPRFRLGTHKANDLVLDHGSVSRFHLEIVADEQGYLVKDLGSTNGTFIDGLRVREAYLPQRAMLRLGEVTLAFTLTGEQQELPASEREDFFGVVGCSPAMREVFAMLERAAPTDATILVEGESGTGKERVAAAVHQASLRSAAPLVVMDCAAVPANLMESELLGHERGAFTGATTRKQGRVQEAHGGTLFLDEIGELPLEMQPKLLRVLETRQVRPVGGTDTRAVDFRLVAATNRDLAREVNRGSFREDLYYRLAVVQITVPPLRQRTEDLRLLVRHFVGLLLDDARRAREILRGISEENWRRLEGLPWSGNVRELRNFIERTLILTGGPIHSEYIPDRAAASGGNADLGPVVDLDRPFSLHKSEVVAAFERSYLLSQLARHDSNVSAAARASGMDRMNFKRLLKKYR